MRRKILVVALVIILVLALVGCIPTVPNVDEEEEPIAYRAFCVGVGDYIYGGDDNDLPGPPYDVDGMIQIFNRCRFGPLNTGFSTINYLKDWQATKSNILQGIASTFSGADNNDVSYFYYSGHGTRLGSTSYLCPADVTSYSLDSNIGVDELENALSAIPGTKVVFLDTCHSGGFIGKGMREITISQEELESFNDEVINVFSQSQSKSFLTTNQYKVLTSCISNQGSWGMIPIFGNPYGVFTKSLCTGCGCYGNYPADTDLDTKVSLQEAYIYVKNRVEYYSGYSPSPQDVQVYPNNSNYTIVEYQIGY
ncbi:caspase family protein [Candidatus Atribacteria bacterium 1244-E10-H5-B2]|nr:MAG: caspase family protein [Candidatus Atribacteria bacterium 1244-E10-H5-B2]